ncbi:MAG: YeeE/YedE family protein [Xanthomonadales bacterium]|nr:YeeE/YedE family protein [Xanthomonadales bacterium]
MKRLAWALLAGAVFGTGLVVSGMSNPNKVLNFLDLLGPWDASLLVVMAVAVPVSALGFRLVWRRGRSASGEPFQLPTSTTIDRPLLVGAGIFGIGWGIAGYCPGPAITALAIMPREAVPFLLAMLAGGAIHHLLGARATRRADG